MKTYWVETYGCQMNKAESEALALEFDSAGYKRVEEPCQARVVLLNTCSIRKTAEDHVWGRLGYYRALKKKQDITLVLTGCMVERMKEEILERAPHVDLLVGNFRKHRILETLGCTQPAAEPEPASYRFFPLHRASGSRAYLPILHGCNNACSYCVVPLVRGPEVSRDPVSIMHEIALLEERGVREITLLGQNVNSYSFSMNGSRHLVFHELLRHIARNLRRIRRVRFLTSHPKDFNEDLIQTLAEEPILCKHIHLPVQHGSDRILKRMNRGYTVGRYLELVERIRSRIPEASLTTDILIGFPGESDEDFRSTLELMRRVEFHDAFTYRYNPREGTAAFFSGDDVPDAVKRERLQEVIDLQRAISARRRRARIGCVVDVLVEEPSLRDPRELLGRTGQDETVVFPAGTGRIGDFARVLLTALRGNTLRGMEVS